MWSEFAQLASAEMGKSELEEVIKRMWLFCSKLYISWLNGRFGQSIKVVNKPKLRVILIVQSGRCEITNISRLETLADLVRICTIGIGTNGRIRIGRKLIWMSTYICFCGPCVWRRCIVVVLELGEHNYTKVQKRECFCEEHLMHVCQNHSDALICLCLVYASWNCTMVLQQIIERIANALQVNLWLSVTYHQCHDSRFSICQE